MDGGRGEEGAVSCLCSCQFLALHVCPSKEVCQSFENVYGACANVAQLHSMSVILKCGEVTCCVSVLRDSEYPTNDFFITGSIYVKPFYRAETPKLDREPCVAAHLFVEESFTMITKTDRDWLE